MTAREIWNLISAMPANGILTEEQRMSQKYVYALMANYRGALVRLRYKETGTIHPAYYQKYYFDYSKDLQESNCYVRFFCPPPLSISKDVDGFFYVGTIPEGSIPSIAWSRIKTRPALSNYNAHQTMKKILEKNTSALWENQNQMWEVYGNLDIREGMVEGVFANPFDIPGYNKEIDNFPVVQDDLALLTDLIYKGNTSIVFSRNPDLLSTSNDLTKQLAKA
jgi:hypothetical protein